jgi:UDP-2,4-diacetamido-2,4,6-trideoxy-beta-L-altropyranose hydrolase
LDNNSDKIRILFRADGDNKIGLGHIYRCIAIADRLREFFECYFVIRQASAELEKSISKISNLFVIESFENYDDDAEYLVINIINKYKINIVTLDGYYFNTSYQKIIKKKCDAILISIDDDHPFHYFSDIVINHSGGIVSDKISKEIYTKTYLGYDYLMLRKEFIKSIKKEKKICGIKTILICFGGADPEDFTGNIVNCLKDQRSIQKITIVVGAAYANLAKLKNNIAAYKHIVIKSNLDAIELVKVMRNTDMAIVPASTVSLEAFASKMILITGMTADNQKYIYEGLIKENTVYGIEKFIDLTCITLLNVINQASMKFNNYLIKPINTVNVSLEELYKSMA